MDHCGFKKTPARLYLSHAYYVILQEYVRTKRSIVYFIWTNGPVPTRKNHFHSITLPLSCHTVGTSYQTPKFFSWLDEYSEFSEDIKSSLLSSLHFAIVIISMKSQCVLLRKRESRDEIRYRNSFVVPPAGRLPCNPAVSRRRLTVDT